MTTDTAGTARGGMTMDTSETTRLRALLERAEDGTWEVDAIDPFLVTTDNPSKGVTSHIAQVVCPMDEDGDPYEANAALIVGAVNALPTLLNKADALDAAQTAAIEAQQHALALRDRFLAIERQRDDLAALRPRDPHRTGHGCACCGREGAPDEDGLCPWCSDGMATMRERDALREQLAAVTAQRDALRKHYDAAGPEHDLLALLDLYHDRELAAQRERDVALAHIEPLTRDVDALRAAARAAGWSDADARGETLVAWVRRGEREACAVRCDEDAEAEAALGRSDGAWALRHLAKSLRVRAKNLMGGE